MATIKHRTRRSGQAGFNYPVIMAAMVIVGVLLAEVGEVWHTVAIREKEAQLLFIGNEYRQAIGRYYELTPGGTKQYPQSLDDLVLDRRFPKAVRHLRKRYDDPFLKSAEWGLVLEQGHIIGVYSQADGVPMRTQDGLPAEAVSSTAGSSATGEVSSYSAWKFVYRPAIQIGVGNIAPK